MKQPRTTLCKEIWLSTIPGLFSVVLEGFAGGKDKRRKSKIQIGKEVKFPLFSDDMILYIRDTQKFYQKLPTIKDLNKVAGYKIKLQN